jgi:hypothetical protein
MKTNKPKINNSETMISFRCSHQFASWLDKVADRIQVPRSEYIRASLLNINPTTVAFALVKEKKKSLTK